MEDEVTCPADCTSTSCAGNEQAYPVGDTVVATGGIEFWVTLQALDPDSGPDPVKCVMVQWGEGTYGFVGGSLTELDTGDVLDDCRVMLDTSWWPEGYYRQEWAYVHFKADDGCGVSDHTGIVYIVVP